MPEMQTTIFETDIVDFSNEVRRTVVEGTYIVVTDVADTVYRTITTIYGVGETIKVLHATD